MLVPKTLGAKQIRLLKSRRFESCVRCVGLIHERIGLCRWWICDFSILNRHHRLVSHFYQPSFRENAPHPGNYRLRSGHSGTCAPDHERSRWVVAHSKSRSDAWERAPYHRSIGQVWERRGWNKGEVMVRMQNKPSAAQTAAARVGRDNLQFCPKQELVQRCLRARQPFRSLFSRFIPVKLSVMC